MPLALGSQSTEIYLYIFVFAPAQICYGGGGAVQKPRDLFLAGGGRAEGPGAGPGRETGDAATEAIGRQGKAERAGEAQDPAGAGAGMEEQNAGTAGRSAAAPQRSTEGGPWDEAGSGAVR